MLHIQLCTNVRSQMWTHESHMNLFATWGRVGGRGEKTYFKIRNILHRKPSLIWAPFWNIEHDIHNTHSTPWNNKDTKSICIEIMMISSQFTRKSALVVLTWTQIWYPRKYSHSLFADYICTFIWYTSTVSQRYKSGQLGELLRIGLISVFPSVQR